MTPTPTDLLHLALILAVLLIAMDAITRTRVLDVRIDDLQGQIRELGRTK